MLEYDGIDVSEGIDVNKVNVSKECDKGIKFEPYLCSHYHDLMQKSMRFNDVAIASVKGSDYRTHFWYTSKDDDAINIAGLGLKKYIVS